MAISSGKHPTISAAPDGSIVRAAFVPDSGSPGSPGKIYATFQAAGDVSQSSPFTFKDDTGTPLAVVDDTFHLSRAYEHASRWVLVVGIDGDTGVSDWWSGVENAESWTRVV